jgi:tetraacyldisaccharide 4'-kinase
MTMLRDILLWPVATIYGSAVALRNRLYDLGILRSHKFNLPVICVGNITVGGTGKTPHVIYIADKLSQHFEVSVLSRGYLRKSHGFRAVLPGDSVSVAGDEPLLMSLRLPSAGIFVDRDRVNGIRKIMKTAPTTGAVILDDGFQHRSVSAGKNILLTSYNRLMMRDRLLPLGRLRESLRGIRRADIIIVTKVPQGLTDDDRLRISNEISPGQHQSLFFTALAYLKPVPLFGQGEREITSGTSVLLVTGIADPEPLFVYLSGISAGVTHLNFPDHHRFSEKNIRDVASAFEAIKSEDKMIVTTEKDCVRLKEITNIADLLGKSIYCLPIGVEFIDNEEEFIKLITEYAGKYHKNS